MGQEMFLNRQKQVGELMEKRGLLQRIAYNTYLQGSILLQKISNLLGKKGLITSIGSAVMNAVKSVFISPTGFLGPLAVPIALAASGLVGAVGYKFLADDLKSEGKPGYGKRTLLAPPNAFALNDNDTIIATTNKPRAPSSDTSALAESINSMHNTLKQSINKPSIAYINGEDAFTRRLGSNPYLGTSQNMDTAYQVA